jgi:hypothetical protein
VFDVPALLDPLPRIASIRARSWFGEGTSPVVLEPLPVPAVPPPRFPEGHPMAAAPGR